MSVAMPPEGTELVEEFLDYGCDGAGHNAFFGFQVNGARRHFAVNHETLGLAILYLQEVASEARTLRLSDPKAAALEVREIPANPVLGVSIDVDVVGHSAALACTTQFGICQELLFPYEMLLGLFNGLPGVIAEMQKRQREASEKH